MESNTQYLQNIVFYKKYLFCKLKNTIVNIPYNRYT
uniref:Acetyl-CoA carboxylase carboxyltransferase beta subunit n=1 Tax=Bromus catharticus TaxID=52150 RepID=A0A873WSC5_BROCA|nr:acetyl-CoA carboxylase carboxyltransferase beta subunit [Bromus catharticus]QPB15223.1 acetyl-CoA carboxylase carboxyltransferase beta subunit [Bromus catharticus]